MSINIKINILFFIFYKIIKRTLIKGLNILIDITANNNCIPNKLILFNVGYQKGKSNDNNLSSNNYIVSYSSYYM